MPRKTRPEATPEPPGEDLLERKGFITTEELAAYLRVPMGTLDQWASRGGGPSFHKVGIHRRYNPADVREWLRTTWHNGARGDAA